MIAPIPVRAMASLIPPSSALENFTPKVEQYCQNDQHDDWATHSQDRFKEIVGQIDNEIHNFPPFIFMEYLQINN